MRTIRSRRFAWRPWCHSVAWASPAVGHATEQSSARTRFACWSSTTAMTGNTGRPWRRPWPRVPGACPAPR